MIISPPFLLNRNDNETDEAWINRCMPGGAPGDGAYPLARALQWHGGIHLDEPERNAPVRAIADGELVYMRRPTPLPDGPLAPDHPQAYQGGWTDNGVVILKHTTEIGEGANGNVTFFSIYMHLREIDAAVLRVAPQPNPRVYRKAPLGRAGQVCGATGKLHFEIVCDDVNLKRLVGRAGGELNTASDGRTDAIYGTMYFRLPVGTSIYADQPMSNNPVAHRPAPRPSGAARNTPPGAPLPLQAAHTTTQTLFVGLRYAGGEGEVANRGDAYVSTYGQDGTPVGEPLEENEAEYNLYTTATSISRSYPATAQPAPSAVYELLRFGRVIGPDALAPANVPHWRRISYPGGMGWVNLNAANVRKFSDADFPHWTGWTLVDDSADQDSRCDSAIIKGWLDVNGDGKVTPAEALARMMNSSVAPKLAKAICKFPTEWNAPSFDRRLGWIKTSTIENPTPVDPASYERLRAHVTALAFWPGGMGLPESHWHWNPREFIRHFRTCARLDDSLLQRLYPDATTESRTRYRMALNRVMQKYFVNGSRHRTIHFLGQGAHESGQLNRMIEGGNTPGSRQPETSGWYNDGAETYFNQYNGRNGNIELRDGIKFRGRGMKQLTGRYNYGYYWAYRGWIAPASFSEPWWSPSRVNQAPSIDNPEFAGTDPYTTIDAGGWYWESTPLRGVNRGRGRRLSSVNSLLDRNVHSGDLIRLVTILINGGDIGLLDRRNQTQRIFEILKDG